MEYHNNTAELLSYVLFANFTTYRAPFVVSFIISINNVDLVNK